jgi:hypothetical protein
LDGIVRRDFTAAHLFEQVFQLFRIHGNRLAPKSRR